MPATFSTALPAIATTTIPANACDMCINSIAGSSALTNHSDTSAAPKEATMSTTTASHSGQLSCASGLATSLRAGLLGSDRRENGRLAANTINNKIEQAAPSAASCDSAGVCSSAASVGIASAVTASIINDA